ncbi:plasma membrane H+-ATPase, partial [Gamsiella multidivaricata]
MARGYFELHDDPNDEQKHPQPRHSNKRDHSHEGDVELDDLFLTNPQTGLSHEQVAERLQTFGRNELVEVKRNQFLKFLGYFIGPIAFLIQLACIISAIVQ